MTMVWAEDEPRQEGRLRFCVFKDEEPSGDKHSVGQ